MGRPRKDAKLVKDREKYNFTLAEKKYIDLLLKTSNNVNYDQLFKQLAVELDKPEEVIRAYANKLDIQVVDQQLSPEPAPKVLRPEQEFIRNMLTPNRNTEPNKAKHVTVMSEAASENVEKMPKGPLKGSRKFRDNVFRQ